MYSKLIREIKTAITNPSLPIEFLADLADEYQEACESIHERMLKISGLLNAGYREEAIELAEQKPNVLEGIYQLDFPEHAHWLALLAAHQIDTPPALPLEPAADLEFAYETQRELEPLMKNHRLLALAQAPLSARILTLSKLAQRDPLNPLWPADSETLQRARLTEIKNEFNWAKSKGLTDHLSRLASELKQPLWSVPIPQSLLSGVTVTTQNLARDRARTQMIDLATALNDTLVEYDDAAARPLREQWHALNKTAQLPPDHETAILAAEPLAWLGELDADAEADRQYKAAVHALETGVAEQIPVEELERKIYEVQKFEREVPQSLVDRTQQYRESELVNLKRKTTMRIYLIAAALLATIGITVFLIVQGKAKSALASARQQMQQLATDANYDAGHRFFDALPAYHQSDGEILNHYASLSQAEIKQQQHTEKFQQLISRFSLDGPLTSQQSSIIDEAEQLAETEAEKKQVTILSNRLASERDDRQNKRNAAFMETLQPLKSRIDELMGSNDWANSIPELNRLTREIDTLLVANSTRVDLASGISPALERNAQTLLRSANLRISELEKHSQAHSALANLKFELTDFDKFASALDEFAKKFPTHSNADEFARSAREKETWNNLVAWQTFANQEKLHDFANLKPEISANVVKRTEELNARLELPEQQPSIKAMLQYFQDKQDNAVDPEESLELIEKVRSFFKQPKFVIQDVLQRGVEQYYLEKPIDSNGTVKYFSENAEVLGTKQKPGDVTGVAPHCQLSKSVLRVLELAHRTKPDCQSLTFDMLDAALAKPDAKIANDPLVQCEFIDQILLFAKYTSPALETFAEEQRDELKRLDVLGKEWLAKCDNIEAGDRRKASFFLADLPRKISTAKNEMAAPAKTDLSKLKTWCDIADYQLAGFLSHENGEWIIHPHNIKSLPPRSELLVLVPGVSNQGTFQNVGRYENGTLTPGSSETNLQSGRPLFFRKQ